jgi:O-antigen ligase
MGMIVAGICLFVYLTDTTFWERMGTIKGGSSVEMRGGSRIFFWMKTFDLVKQHPFGVGGWGYQYLSHEFLPDEMLTGGSGGLRRRAVHSTYFQCFAEYGYPGIPIFGGLLLSTFLFMRKSKRYLFNKGKFFLYYQGIAIESGLVGYLTSAIFLSLLYPEILYWFILFTACFGNIYMLKDRGLDKMAALDKEPDEQLLLEERP